MTSIEKGRAALLSQRVFLQDHGYNEQLISYCYNVGLSSIRKLQLFLHTLKYLGYTNWLLLDRAPVYFTFGWQMKEYREKFVCRIPVHKSQAVTVLCISEVYKVIAMGGC